MTTTLTFDEALARHNIAVPDALAGLEVPFLSGPQRQGDVLVVPSRPSADRGGLVGREGVAVVRGETTGGNAHILDAYEGPVYWRPAAGLVLGVVTVPEGSKAVLTHTDEHGCNGLLPGTYTLRGKRTQRDEIERVRD